RSLPSFPTRRSSDLPWLSTHRGLARWFCAPSCCGKLPESDLPGHEPGAGAALLGSEGIGGRDRLGEHGRELLHERVDLVGLRAAGEFPDRYEDPPGAERADEAGVVSKTGVVIRVEAGKPVQECFFVLGACPAEELPFAHPAPVSALDVVQFDRGHDVLRRI